MTKKNCDALRAGARLASLLAPAPLLAQYDHNPAAGCAGCLACGVFPMAVLVAIIALHIAILVWVARDAKSRGMDSAVLWMILVMVTGLIGLIIYLLARPQGNLILCPNCHNNRLQASLRCPHCGA